YRRQDVATNAKLHRSILPNVITHTRSLPPVFSRPLGGRTGPVIRLECHRLYAIRPLSLVGSDYSNNEVFRDCNYQDSGPLRPAGCQPDPVADRLLNTGHHSIHRAPGAKTPAGALAQG